MKSASIENKLTLVSKRSDGIVEIRFKRDEYEVNRDDLSEILSAYAKLSDNGKMAFPIIVVSGMYGSISTEAREKEIFQRPPMQDVVAMAMVVNSMSQRILGKMLMKLKKNQPLFPYQLFKKEEDALQWLKAVKQLAQAA